MTSFSGDFGYFAGKIALDRKGQPFLNRSWQWVMWFSELSCALGISIISSSWNAHGNCTFLNLFF